MSCLLHPGSGLQQPTSDGVSVASAKPSRIRGRQSHPSAPSATRLVSAAGAGSRPTDRYYAAFDVEPTNEPDFGSFWRLKLPHL